MLNYAKPNAWYLSELFANKSRIQTHGALA